MGGFWKWWDRNESWAGIVLCVVASIIVAMLCAWVITKSSFGSSHRDCAVVHPFNSSAVVECETSAGMGFDEIEQAAAKICGRAFKIAQERKRVPWRRAHIATQCLQLEYSRQIIEQGARR